jgi:hypothetical protein
MVLFHIKERSSFGSVFIHLSMGVSGVLKPPPANWKSHLQGQDRANAWKYAAGENKDGTAKSTKLHSVTRCSIRQLEALRFIGLKPGDERTAEDREMLRKADEKRKKNCIAMKVHGSARAAVKNKIMRLLTAQRSMKIRLW